MTTTTDHGTLTPEVQHFLAAVRAQLADLDPDERRDITEGLEADLTDLVAERGGEALGDPVAYARELRAAAGLEPDMGRRREHLDVAAAVHGFFDDVHRLWDRLIASLPGDASGFVAAVRPVWWVLRGWVAVEMVAMWLGDWSLTIVPGGELPGVAAVAVGVLLSIQLGRGRLWPGDAWRRVVLLRTLLLTLNLFAIAMIPVVLNGLDHGKNSYYSRGFDRGVDTGYQNGLQEVRDSGQSTDKAGLYVDGTWVSNIYPYDAQGRPLVGVQLFNQIGQPINVITQPEYPPDACSLEDENGACLDPGTDVALGADGNPLPRVFYPWSNGATQLLNVFPIPSRLQVDKAPDPTAFTAKVRPEVGPFPLASVPKVSLPGIVPSRLTVPKG